jgi:hypothetical protein
MNLLEAEQFQAPGLLLTPDGKPPRLPTPRVDAWSRNEPSESVPIVYLYSVATHSPTWYNTKSTFAKSDPK